MVEPLYADFAEVVGLERPRILLFILSSVRDRDLAADLTQECFCKAYQGWPRFRGDSSVHTWLRRIAVNVIRSFMRSKKLQLFRRAAPIDKVLEGSMTDDALLSPEDAAIYRDSITRIWAATDAISPKQQIAMQLRFNADLELAEIATAMGVTESSVKTVGGPVVDKTGLSASYDFKLSWESGESISRVLEEQLGLKLEAQKVPVEFITIVSAQRPSEN
jgi:RNA polymerase sigma-70 factor (ECF subfamily)